MQQVRAYRVGRLFIRSLSPESRGAGGAKPLERLEIELGPQGAPARSERVGLIVFGVMAAFTGMIAVSVWQPFLGPLMAGAALLVVLFMMMARAIRRVGKRLVADGQEIRVEETTFRRDETRVSLQARNVERVEIGDEPDHRSVWAQTRDGERVVLLEDLTEEEAQASAKRLRDTLPPPPG